LTSSAVSVFVGFKLSLLEVQEKKILKFVLPDFSSKINVDSQDVCLAAGLVEIIVSFELFWGHVEILDNSFLVSLNHFSKLLVIDIVQINIFGQIGSWDLSSLYPIYVSEM